MSVLEDFDCVQDEPSGKRWPPLGADDLDAEFNDPATNREVIETERLCELEEQQELLNSSLIALTSHFAQVQFRLRQIVDAPHAEKEELLKALEAFAFSGIPEVHDEWGSNISRVCTEDTEGKMEAQRAKQRELISQLKSQLEDLETYAYETGEAGLPQSVILERQRVVIDQLKSKLNINMENMDTLTVDDLRSQVDFAVSRLINPLKMKEHLVTQLKTQIVDLERFIEFLQGDGQTTNASKCSCNCPIHCKKSLPARKSENRNVHEIRNETINLMKKITTLLQMFASAQFGCTSASERFTRNSLKKTMKANHWGDLRADLEMAVNHVLELANQPSGPASESAYLSDSEDSPAVLCNVNLTTAVRKRLTISIRNLMQHGLMPVGQAASVVPFVGCFALASQSHERKMHPWELILHYYHLKNGDSFNSTPARKLSQSFNLDMVGGTAISTKQNLLSIIGNIIGTHVRYKRSYDSHLKAFICAALNYNKLVPWLRLIFRCQSLLESYYQAWSYVAKTGFEDSLQSLDKLTDVHFELPVDLAIRQLQNIKDAF